MQATGKGKHASRACATELDKKTMGVARLDPVLFPIPSRPSFLSCGKCLLPYIVKHLKQLLPKCLQKWHKSGYQQDLLSNDFVLSGCLHLNSGSQIICSYKTQTIIIPLYNVHCRCPQLESNYQITLLQ
jgi:hypothetical protein